MTDSARQILRNLSIHLSPSALVADTVMVLRDGKTVDTMVVSGTTENEIVKSMVGAGRSEIVRA